MERAASSCVAVMEEKELDLSNVLIVCGSGNNGGDGFAIARILLEKGHNVHVLFAGKMESRSTETIQQMEWFEKKGGSFCNSYEEDEYTVVIDALFGVGLNRDIKGAYGDLIEKMNQSCGVKFAVDTP
ncbi:MAG: NAD(P)H-hydrate epimerase, partial [Phascolarctobacterium sp.]|nr:NAD(P)H-hydrate epimerase [Phascolarctobacterium sp.]